jgi:hypothetical protein
MAAGEHWLTNRGMLLLMQGKWESGGAAAGAIKCRLLVGASVPAAHTKANVQTVNTVADLLALSGFAEATGGWYTAGGVSLTRSNATEEDASGHQIHLDAADVVRTSVTAGSTIWGGFWVDTTVDTSDTTRLCMGCYAYSTPIPTNGSNFTETITDLVRVIQP